MRWLTGEKMDNCPESMVWEAIDSKKAVAASK